MVESLNLFWFGCVLTGGTTIAAIALANHLLAQDDQPLDDRQAVTTQETGRWHVAYRQLQKQLTRSRTNYEAEIRQLMRQHETQIASITQHSQALQSQWEQQITDLKNQYAAEITTLQTELQRLRAEQKPTGNLAEQLRLTQNKLTQSQNQAKSLDSECQRLQTALQQQIQLVQQLQARPPQTITVTVPDESKVAHLQTICEQLRTELEQKNTELEQLHTQLQLQNAEMAQMVQQISDYRNQPQPSPTPVEPVAQPAAQPTEPQAATPPTENPASPGLAPDLFPVSLELAENDSAEVTALKQECQRLQSELQQQSAQVRKLCTSLAEASQHEAQLATLQAEYQRLKLLLQNQRGDAPSQSAESPWQDAVFQHLQPLFTHYPTAIQMVEAKPKLAAKTLLPLFQPLTQLLQQWQYQPIGKAWEAVPYNPALHQGDSPDLVPGERVYVRFVGYRHGDRVVCPARVSRTLPGEG